MKKIKFITKAILFLFLSSVAVFAENEKYRGGSSDGHDVITSDELYLNGDITFSYSKYRGGSSDGHDIIASDLIYLDGSITFAFGKYNGGFGDGYASNFSLSDISLPVLLSSFDLSENRGFIRISWRTESEVDNSHWLVQRKIDEPGEDFMNIAEIEGNGTVSTATDYEYMDEVNELGLIYSFRLADIALNGNITFHEEKMIEVGLPEKFMLYQNYPNPFNPTTTIKYDLPAFSEVRIDVYNILGQRINRLINEKKKPGYHKLVWDGTNEAGIKAASGMYIFTLQARGLLQGKQQGYQKAKKMVLVK